MDRNATWKGEDVLRIALQPSLASDTQPFLHGDLDKRTSTSERSLQPPGEERWMVEGLQ